MMYVMCTELLHCILNPVGKVYKGFSLLGEMGVGSSTNQKFAHSPPPHQIFVPSDQKLTQPNKKIKTSFLAVAIAPVPFLI